MLKKIVFPFFNSNKHNFLTKKWRFRVIISLYILILIIGGPIIRRNKSYDYYSTCSLVADTLHTENKYDNPYHIKAIDECSRYIYHEMIYIVATLFIVTHYLIQLIFFKWLIDYIVLENE